MKVPIASRAYVILTGLIAVGAVIYCAMSHLPMQHYWYLAGMCLLASFAATARPFTVIHAGTRGQFSATAMVLVACPLLLPFQISTLAFAIGPGAAGLVGFKGLWIAVEDSANDTLSAFGALAIGHLIAPVGLTPQSIVAAIVVGLIFDPLSLMLLTIANMARGRAGFWSFYRAGMAATLPILPWLLSIGILLGAIGAAVPWALPLTAAPLALVFMASTARVAATEDRTRLDGLLGAATLILAATSVSAVTASAIDSARVLFEGGLARVSKEPGGPGELSVPLVTERLGTLHLVVASRIYAYNDHDRLLLEALASITASALDKAALHDDIAEQATTDALTGLTNRRAFEEQVRSTLAGMRASDGAGIIFIDLDRFKEINDVHGHQAGDEVLMEAARRLNMAVRGGDIVARLGGDEFTILLRGVHQAGDATLVADRVLESMRLSMRLTSGVEVSTTPSIGIALALQGDMDPVQLLKEADAAMYEAKRAGKDCWRLFGRGVRVA